MKYSQKTLHSSPERARYGVSFVSSKGNIFCRLIKIELYKIFAIINRAIKGLHCNGIPHKIHWYFFFFKFLLVMNQHWFRLWLGTKQATGHYLKKEWQSLLMDMCITNFHCVNSLVPERRVCNLKFVNFKLISSILNIFCKIALRRIRQHLTDD